MLIVAVLLSATPAFPLCEVPQPRLVCAEYFSAAVVVEATLLETTELDDDVAHLYSFRVSRIIRGQVGQHFELYEGNDSQQATFDWVEGRDYLLFLMYSPDIMAWELDNCGNSGPLAGAQHTLSAIRAIKPTSHTGEIYGVVSGEALSTPLAGVHVEAHGSGHVYSAVTNQKGQFQMKVPTGQYTIDAVQSGFSFNTADISYENARAVHVQPGGCAQLQLSRAESP